MKKIALILLALSLSGCAKCISGHNETGVRPHCQSQSMWIYSYDGSAPKYATTNICLGTEEYQYFVCDQYEQK